jgi:hypothetical protein
MPITHSFTSAKSDGGDATLVRPSDWNAAHVGGGLELLEQHTASASATLDFTTFISATYDDYVFRFLGLVNATDTQDLLMRMGTGGGPTYDTGANYSSENYVWRAGAAAVSGATGATSIKMNFNGATVSNAQSGMPLSGRADFYLPQNTTAFKDINGVVTYWDGTFRVNNFFNGKYESATAVTAVRFFFASGNITSGTIRVYGIAKS